MVRSLPQGYVSMRRSALSEADLHLLEQVASRKYDHIANIPESVQGLMRLGLVNIVSTLSYPVMPSMYDCRLTLKGYDLLQQ